MSSTVIEEKSFEAVLASLSEPLPDSLVKQRVGWRDSAGEQHLVDYIDWHTAADILDRVCPDWSHEVRDITVIGDLVAVTAAIKIKGVTRCGIGVDSALDEKGIKSAEHDALKRAAVKFGLARSLYSKGTTRRRASSSYEAQPGEGRSSETRPRAARSEDQVTDKQLSAIYAIAKAKSLDAQLESMALFRCEPEKLSRSAASELIDHLRNVRISA